MKVFTKEFVLLRDLSILFDTDYRINTLALTSQPAVASGTGRQVTPTMLENISTVLYHHPNAFQDAFSKKFGTNLLQQPVYCSLIVSDHILVAIGSEVTETYCYLPSGALLTEAELFETCKSTKLQSLASQRSFLQRRLANIESTYETVKKMTFHAD